MCHHHTHTARKRRRSSSSSVDERTREERSGDKENNGASNKYETRACHIADQSGRKPAACKRQRARASPTAVDDRADASDIDSATEDSEAEDAEDAVDAEQATAEHRDEIVAALLTITSALGLSKETLYVCVDLLDRYLERRSVEISRLEVLSIACLWLAIKFVETPTTIAGKSIKQTLQRRRLSGNWTWDEVLELERTVLRALDYRVMAPTVLSLLQRRLYADASAAYASSSSSSSDSGSGTDDTGADRSASAPAPLSAEQRHLALYFADLLLLTSRARAHSCAALASAAEFVAGGRRVQDAPAALLAPVLLLFVAHRDTINPAHRSFKARFALRCQFGARLRTPWRVPFDPDCGCRVCARASQTAEPRSAAGAQV